MSSKPGTQAARPDPEQVEELLNELLEVAPPTEPARRNTAFCASGGKVPVC